MLPLDNESQNMLSPASRAGKPPNEQVPIFGWFLIGRVVTVVRPFWAQWGVTKHSWYYFDHLSEKCSFSWTVPKYFDKRKIKCFRCSNVRTFMLTCVVHRIHWFRIPEALSLPLHSLYCLKWRRWVKSFAWINHLLMGCCWQLMSNIW